MSTRELKRKREKEAKKRFSLPAGEFRQIALNEFSPRWMTRAYTNNRYVVMIDDNSPTNGGNAIRAMIQRHDDKPITNHWSEIQSIKNEIFGFETMAIEYYPKASELIDQHNIYWIWIFPEGVIPIPNNSKG